MAAVEAIGTAADSGISWIDWLPVILSACTLLFNVLFYFYFKDYLAFKYTRTADLAKISAEFLVYLTGAVSFDDFDGVPTQIKNYSEQILLCFKSGEQRVSITLEELFMEAQRRKQLEQDDEIQLWRDNFRLLTSELQKELRKHCGVIK
jgi:hypothetical protein